MHFQRSIDFARGEDGDGSSSSMALYLSAELDELDASALAGLANVTACDDLGTILKSEPDLRGPFSFGGGGGGLPDEWSTNLNMPAPHPRARKLAWLQGDLMVYGRVVRHELELPLPAPRGTVRRLGPVTLTFLELSVPAEEPHRPAVRFMAAYPSELDLSGVGGARGFVPELVDTAGRVYRPYGSGASGRTTDGLRSMTFRADFPALEAPAAAVRLRLLERAELRRLFTFRMTEIPLPPGGRLAPRRAVRPPAPRPLGPWTLDLVYPARPSW